MRCIQGGLIHLVLFFLLLLLPARGLASRQVLAVQSITGGTMVCDPGQIVSLAFRVSLREPRSQEILESLLLPANWKALIEPSGFLQTRASEVRIIAFRIPADAPAGPHKISYFVQVRDMPSLRASNSVLLQIKTIRDLSLLIEEYPRTVIAGDVLRARLRIMNKGNAPVRARISASSSEGYPLVPSVREETAAIGSSLPVEFRVQTDAAAPWPLQHHLRIMVEIQGDQGEDQAPLIRDLGTEIVPSVTGWQDPYQRIPTRFRLVSTSEGSGQTLRGEFSGGGGLDAAGNQSIDFRFRGPNTRGESIFGEWDQYYLRYKSERLGLQLGDCVYRLSRLSEHYLLGRGVSFDLRRLRGINTGAFFLASRPDSEIREMAAYIAGELSQRLCLRVNYLDKEQEVPEVLRDRILSLQSVLRPWRSMAMDLEYARDHPDREGAKIEEAYRVRVSSAVGQKRFIFERTYAGSDFQGQYRNHDQIMGSLSFPMGSRVHVHGLGQRWKRIASLSMAENTAIWENSLQGGIRCELPAARLGISLEGRRSFSDSGTVPANQEHRETTLRLGLSHSRTRYSFSTHLEGGLQSRPLDETERFMGKLSVSLFARPSWRQSHYLSADFSNATDQAVGLFSEGNAMSFSTQWRLTQGFSFTLRGFLNDFKSQTRANQRLFSMTASYALSPVLSLDLRVRRHEFHPGERESAFQLAISRSYGMPLVMKKDFGRVRGRVCDAEAAGRPGIAGVIVRTNGATAVSDENGNFFFPTLDPGSYRISLDRSTLGLDRVPERQVSVTVKGGRTSEIEIGIVRAARLHGSITAFTYEEACAPPARNRNSEFPQPGWWDIRFEGSGRDGTAPSRHGRGSETAGDGGQELFEVTGLANVVVELSDGEETARRVSDSRGRFVFADLRPGRYRLTIHDGNLPRFHFLEQADFQLELAPGGTEEILIKALPLMRPIKIIKQGSLAG